MNMCVGQWINRNVSYSNSWPLVRLESELVRLVARLVATGEPMWDWFDCMQSVLVMLLVLAWVLITSASFWVAPRARCFWTIWDKLIDRRGFNLPRSGMGLASAAQESSFASYPAVTNSESVTEAMTCLTVASSSDMRAMAADNCSLKSVTAWDVISCALPDRMLARSWLLHCGRGFKTLRRRGVRGLLSLVVCVMLVRVYSKPCCWLGNLSSTKNGLPLGVVRPSDASRWSAPAQVRSARL